jgi:hypothetical protein
MPFLFLDAGWEMASRKGKKQSSLSVRKTIVCHRIFGFFFATHATVVNTDNVSIRKANI